MNLISKKELKNKFNLLKAKKIEPSNLECNIDYSKRSLEEEHRHWGAYVDKNKNITFKIATFPDALSVMVEIKPALKRAFKILPLENKCNGVFELTVDSKVAVRGDRYRFIIERPNQPKKRVRDPYSMLQDKFTSWSIIFDHHGYKWHDRKWMDGKNLQKSAG